MKNSSKTTIRRTLSFILTLVLIFIPFTSMVSGETISTGVVSNPETKLTENLKTYLETVDDDEYVPIYIWLTDYDEAVFYSLLSKRLGTTITAQTEEAYIGNKVAEKTEAFENRLEEMKADISAYSLQATEAGEIDIKSFSPMLFRATANISSIMTDTEIENCLNSGMSSREIINLSQRNEFLSSYRTTRKALNNSITDSFQQKLDLSKCRNIYPSVGLTYITLEAKKSYINTIAAYEQVEYIDLEVEGELIVPEIENLTNNSVYSTSSGQYHMNTQYSYNGSGIKIGVVEGNETAEEAAPYHIMFHDDNPYLINRNIQTNIEETLFPETIYNSQHATNSLAIVGGGCVTRQDGVVYSGIATNSSLYYTNTSYYITLESVYAKFEAALEWIVTSQSVHVVLLNLSYQSDYSGSYTMIDKITDKYVVDYRVACTAAAGNRPDDNPYDKRVHSPALAYNAIAVGNVKTAGSINGTSSYNEESYLSNKPDIAAYGTVFMMRCVSGTSGSLGTGTSWAAPQVAGAAALIMQANTDLIGKPDAVKAILIGSADETAISAEETTDESGNTIENNGIIPTADYDVVNSNKIQSAEAVLREKSGAGLLNIEAAIRMANSNLFYSYLIPKETSSINAIFTETYYFSQPKTIEFGLVYEKGDEEIINEDTRTNDIDIRILDANSNAVLFASNDYTNNVEIFKCTLQPGEYKFTAFCGYTSADLNFTMFLSCGCSEKMTSCNYSGEYNNISCSNTGCGFSCQEKNRKVEISKTDSYYGITLTFTMYYSPQKYLHSTRDFDYISEFVVIATENNPNIEIETIIGSGGSNQVTATGEIITRSYEVVVANISTGNYSFPEFTVTATTDCFAQTIALS